MRSETRPATVDGLAPSTLQLPSGPWLTLIDGLCARFPAVPRDVWRDRFARGRVLGDDGEVLAPDTPYRVGREVHYYREVADEPRIPFEERVLHLDEHLLVADKPHFLPVMPSGAHVHETLLGRLIRRTGNAGLVPLHRIDRETAGLVLFSVNRATRAPPTRPCFANGRSRSTTRPLHRRWRSMSFRRCVAAASCRANRSSACVKRTASRTARRASK
jgi:tRNA pseudouridine32 synthase/23S rRNA pseudouridine746 synthase